MITGRSARGAASSRGGGIRVPRRGGGLTGRGRDADSFETQWDILSSALREIHEKNASNLSFEQLYRASYKIVLKKQGDVLYDRVKDYEEQWFVGHVMPAIRKLITNNLVNIALDGISGTTANERRLMGEQFLTGLKMSWEDHNTIMNMTTDVLMYMDRVYCGDNRKVSIFSTTMGLFRDHLLRSRLIESELVTFDILNSVILDQISMEREGDVINKHLIRSCVYMLEGLYETDYENDHEKLYLTNFEPEFLKASRLFYGNECASMLRDGDASFWLRQTKKRIEEEQARCQTTLSMLSTDNIVKVVEDKLIREHLTEFLALEGSGIRGMIENDRIEDLGLLYQLISRVDSSKEPLKIALRNQIIELGTEINQTVVNTDFSAVAEPHPDEAAAEGSSDKAKASKMNNSAKLTAAAIKWVDLVLRLKDKFHNLWEKCLDKDLILQTALTKSFSDFINAFPRCPEYVSLFIDDNLKRGIKGKTEGEIDLVLDKATTLLRYIQNKDIFERYYKKHLARRLLHNKSESSEVEKQMISRMKLEIGNSHTMKLEGMFKDMSASVELTAGYRTHIASLGDLDRKQIELGINVLSANYWSLETFGGSHPMNKDGTRQSCQWPIEIIKLQDSFKSFYLKNRNGRMLTWLGFLGSADIRCVFPKIVGKDGVLGKERRYELNVTTHGMIILLLFNGIADGEYLSFEEILERTNIPESELSRNLYTLAIHPKARVLTKVPTNKEPPKAGDKFGINFNFSSKSVKIKAPMFAGSVNKVEGEEERKDTGQRTDQDRCNIIDTVIVRIMKARKEFTHQLLFAEVITQLTPRFRPDLQMMKRRIESLLERDYLERVEDANVDTYRYLA